MIQNAAFPLIRNVAALQARRFDLLVIGGGIYGAWTAYDAAQRGLSVALIEKNDWGSGTSSASSKLIHGGLRYLEHYEFSLVRHALRERRTLSRIAPHLVRPLNFILPVWQGPRASMFMLSAGLTLYDLLAAGSQPVPRHRRYKRAELLSDYPFIDPERLLGGFRYGDCQEDDARMTMTVVAAAQSAGAVTANRVAAEALLESDGRVTGARVHDSVEGRRFDLEAEVVVNAAGPWARQLPGASAPKVKLIKGTHIVMPAIAGQREAFLLTAGDGRVFFVIPWYGRTLVGTTEQTVSDPAQAQPTDEEIRYLVAGVRNSLPGLGWSEKDVISAFAGVRTLQDEDTGDLSAVSREFVITEPRPGLIMPVGGKYTTSRCDAVDIVDRVYRALRRKPPASRTHLQPLPGAPEGEFEAWQAHAMKGLGHFGVDAESAQWLAQRHGSRVERIGQLLAENPAWRERIHPQAPFILAEAVLAVREEMARSPEDILRRRMPLSLLVQGAAKELDAVEMLLADELRRMT
ncbi:MAG: glycerol-3-phosphate dehydrogenase/oxidase [Nevskiaceae bacterium]|nr:MAG: glycerol-3-phosphate dehydrogenase/oxidase [Nevskiaceae bacterium]